MAALFGGGVVGYHRVDIPRPDEHSQPGTAQSGKGGGGFPVRLGQHRHPVARSLQQPPDDGRAEGGVVHIGVPGNEQEVIKIPSPAGHIVQGHGEESVTVEGHQIPSLSVKQYISRSGIRQQEQLVPTVEFWYTICAVPSTPGSRRRWKEWNIYSDSSCLSRRTRPPTA